jgi:hypothetical protein
MKTMNVKRINILLLIVGILAVLATSAYSAKADDDGRRKIVGTWVCNVHEGSPDPFKALQTFHADGTFTETSSNLAKGEEGPAHGVWSKDGNKYRLTFQLFAFDPASSESVGMIRVRITLRLDSADHLTATSELAEFINPDGTIIELGGGPDAYTCDRLKVLPVP